MPAGAVQQQEEANRSDINYGARLIAWKAREYEVQPKSAEWYWAVGIITFALVVVAIIFNNFLLAFIIAFGMITFVIAVSRPLPEVSYALTPRGIVAGHDFYSYSDLEAYWIHVHDPRDALPSMLLLRSKSPFEPLIAIPIADDIDPKEVDDILSQILPAQEMHPPVIHRILELLGV